MPNKEPDASGEVTAAEVNAFLEGEIDSLGEGFNDTLETLLKVVEKSKRPVTLLITINPDADEVDVEDEDEEDSE